MSYLLIMSIADLVVAGAGAVSVLVLNREIRAGYRNYRAVRGQIKEIRRKV